MERYVAPLREISRMSTIVSTPAYASTTIRDWRTTTTLLGMLDDDQDWIRPVSVSPGR